MHDINNPMMSAHNHEQQLRKSDLGTNAVAGGIAACFTHFIVIPIDVVKTKMQLDPERNSSSKATIQGLRQQIGAIRGLSLGAGPTIYGYFIQGMCKYGLYEHFKNTIYSPIENDVGRNALSAMTSEFIGDIFLTPFEAARIRMVAMNQCRVSTARCIVEILRHEGLASAYKGFLPLVLKQVPYTASKLVVYEYCLGKLTLYHGKNNNIEMAGHNTRPLQVTIGSAIVGGLVSAVVSHPADTILTRINRAKDVDFRSAIREAVQEGVWTGLRPRLLMVGGLASLQLLVYEAVRWTMTKGTVEM